MQDPVGATKDQFGKLAKAKLQYDMAREEAQRNLAPVQSVLDHVSTVHNLDPRTGQTMIGPNMMNPDEQQGYEDDQSGVPTNMNQTMGKMNQSRPSLVGHQPGVAPGDGQTVRPPKMGVPKPGQGGGATRAGNPSAKQFGKPASKPKGSGGMKNKSSGGNKGGVNVTVHASSIPVIRASSTIEKQFGLGILKCGDVSYNDLSDDLRKALKDKVGSSGSDSPCSVGGPYPYIKDVFPLQNYFIYSLDGNYYKQSYKLSSTGDVTLTGDAKKVRESYVAAAGSSKGSKKGWSTRGKGHLSKTEKKAHYDNMESIGMGGMRPIGGPRMGGGMPARTGGGMRPPVRMPSGGGMGRSTMLSAKKIKRIKTGPAQLSDKADMPGSELALNPVMRSSGHSKDCLCARCMKARKMEAGGPGSGRHKEAGTFKRSSKGGIQDKDGYWIGNKVTYEGKKGTAVFARTHGIDYVNPISVKENGRTVLRNKSIDEAHKFMKDTYGIGTLKKDLGHSQVKY